MPTDRAQENRRLVRQAFGPWERGDSGPFFDLIADDVHWTVIGSTVASGVYESKQALIDGAFRPLLEVLEGPLETKLHDVSVDGDKVFLEFESHGRSKNGVDYHQQYCWSMRMREGRIVEIVAYLDTDLLVRVFA